MSKTVEFRITGEFLRTTEYRRGLPRRIEIQRQNSRMILKLAKEIRKQFREPPHGARVTFYGRTKFKEGSQKHLVTRFEGPDGNSELPAVIQVCGKKNCWNHGGAELWECLEKRIEELGLSQVRLEKTGCLGTCKQRPCANCSGCPQLAQFRKVLKADFPSAAKSFK